MLKDHDSKKLLYPVPQSLNYYLKYCTSSSKYIKQNRMNPRLDILQNQIVSLSSYHVSLGKLLNPLNLTFSIHLRARTACTCKSVPGLKYHV